MANDHELKIDELKNISGGFSESQLDASERETYRKLVEKYERYAGLAFEDESYESHADKALEELDWYFKRMKEKYG